METPRITPDQAKSLAEIFTASLQSSDLSEEDANKLIENGVVVIAELKQTIESLASIESDDLRSFHIPEKWEFRPAEEQLSIFQELSEGRLNTDFVLQIVQALFDKKPEGAEGIAIIPKPSKIIQLFGNGCDQENQDYFTKAVSVMAMLMEKACNDKGIKWTNRRSGQLSSDRLQLGAKTAGILGKMEVEMPGDFLVFWAQMGAKHRGKSVRRFLARTASTNEWGLDPYSVGMILLAHFDLLKNYSDGFAIDCAGASYAPRTPNKFDSYLYFFYLAGNVSLCSPWTHLAYDEFGSASGFLAE